MAAKSFVKINRALLLGNAVLWKQSPLDINILCRANYKSCHTLSAAARLQRQKILYSHCLQGVRFCTASSNTIGGSEVKVKYENGLPVFLVPLPSRHELCQFTLRPVSNTLGDFIRCLQQEDHGIDRVSAYNSEGMRLSKSTPLDILLQNNFQLVINDMSYQVKPPASVTTPSEHLQELSDVKNTIAQLYSSLNIENHQVNKERELLEKLEGLKTELQPYESVKSEIAEKARKRTNLLPWLSLSFMGLQFGVLARLTWWEYSWDIMEPVTYFVTYGTAIFFFAYAVLTKQECTYEEAVNREFLLTFHKHAKKKNFNIDHYNKLCEDVHQAELDLKRLRDPLQLQLPIQQLPSQPKKVSV